jgi:prepilin-type processing-associated H-X9-DG protein
MWSNFQFAANDLSSPRILVCPSDTDKFPALDFNPIPGSGTTDSFMSPSKQNNAVSYFYTQGADESSPQRMLVGDRNITDQGSDQEPLTNFLVPGYNGGASGLANLSSTANNAITAANVRWNNKIHERGGNIAFMDGSTQQLTSGKLREALRNAPVVTSVWFPHTTSAGK